MAKKATLAGRKRVQDLAEDMTPTEAKRQELMNLQQSAPAAKQQSQAPGNKHQEEVNQLVNKLQGLYAELAIQGDHNRLHYSRQHQHDMLINEIKTSMLNKAKDCEDFGYTEDKTKTICQAFLDDVRIGLQAVGIQINPLHVRKKRGKG